MRRKLIVGLALLAIMALGSFAAFAIDQTVSSANGPHFGGKIMVVRRDIGGAWGKTPPPSPGKPIPITESASRPVKPILGHGSPGGSTPIASATPETLLANRLSALAQELR